MNRRYIASDLREVRNCCNINRLIAIAMSMVRYVLQYKSFRKYCNIRSLAAAAAAAAAAEMAKILQGMVTAAISRAS